MPDDETYGLSAEELEAARISDMDAREYAEMKDVANLGDFEALQKRRKDEGREPIRNRKTSAMYGGR